MPLIGQTVRLWLISIKFQTRLFVPCLAFRFYGNLESFMTYISSSICIKHLLCHITERRKQEVEKNTKKRKMKQRWKCFQAQEGKHLREVCLWKQTQIIIVKTQAQRGRVGLRVGPKLQGFWTVKNSLLLYHCTPTTPAVLSFFVVSADVSHLWHTHRSLSWIHFIVWNNWENMKVSV